MVAPLGTYPFGPSLQIERYRLDNGLVVLVVVDDSAPVVCYQTWFAVGSRHEREGKTGIAHLFEHLMFNETENLPYGEFDRRLEQVGAESNAATFLDWTYYLENLPKDALELAVELESERMQHLVLKSPQVESEREVVANERRQTVDDDVDGSVSELLYSQAFSRHGYRFPTIGTMADIEGLTTEDCRAFYSAYYAPNNACLVVVGDVDPAGLLALVSSRYGQIPAAELPPEPDRREPPQRGQRRMTVTKPTATCKLAIGYKSPAMADADHAPLSLLTETLFGGRSSRVHQQLVEERELASDVGGYLGNFRDPSLLDMYLTARADVSGNALLAALDDIFEALLDNEPPTEAELERARAQLELATLQELETASGKAEQIGFHETVLGDPAAMFARLDAFGRTTVADLERVAERYLRREQRTVVLVDPQ